mgnify:CR=1 FL=1
MHLLLHDRDDDGGESGRIQENIFLRNMYFLAVSELWGYKIPEERGFFDRGIHDAV